MARVTVEDCLEKVPNRFALVILAAKRTKQLMEGSSKLVRSENKDAVTSLREIAAGKVKFKDNIQNRIVRLYAEKDRFKDIPE